jgi:hypothetical protein
MQIVKDRMLRNATECYGMLQNAKECYIMLRYATERRCITTDCYNESQKIYEKSFQILVTISSSIYIPVYERSALKKSPIAWTYLLASWLGSKVAD